jgi:uncharacterized protein YjiS (DUF1127 family)
MGVINSTTELADACAKRQTYSPLETFWSAFQVWRKHEKLRTELCRLTDNELADIGITRGEIDYVASNQRLDSRRIRSAE